MPRVGTRVASAIIVLLPVVILATGLTKAQRTAIDTYAITNARIVTVSGPAITRGTVVIRDGLIAAVGANVTVPADARIIDGTGLTVYPGLIDSSTALGIPQLSPSPSPSPGVTGAGFAQLRQQTTAISAPNSTQPPGLQPEVLAEDFIRPGGDQIEAARNVGITTTLTSATAGNLEGQSALINLAGDTTQQMILRSPWLCMSVLHRFAPGPIQTH